MTEVKLCKTRRSEAIQLGTALGFDGKAASVIAPRKRSSPISLGKQRLHNIDVAVLGGHHQRGEAIRVKI